MRRFASEIKAGDVFLLRTGIATIAAVGFVAGDYLCVSAFDDVNDWDLQHARRMRWCRLPAEHAFGGAAFGANPSRCSRVGFEAAHNAIADARACATCFFELKRGGTIST